MSIFWLWACAANDVDVDSGNTDEWEEVTTYSFFVDGASTTSYSGQVARHALISSLSSYIGGLGNDIASGGYFPASEEQVIQDVLFFVECPDFLCSDIALGTSNWKQDTIGAISPDKNLIDKLAGNDSVTDHKDWTHGDFLGWEGALSPEDVLHTWFSILASQTFAQVNGNFALTPDGSLIAQPYLTPEGLDIQQLSQKFLLGAIAFSQGTDDYLDDETQGKGLLSSHLLVEGQAYTELEHAWDEGFGYFGAAQNYGDYSSSHINNGENIDANGDGWIDLTTEYNWGHSQNAGKRDFGAVESTAMATQAWDGFLRGRELLHNTRGRALTDTEYEELLSYRNHAIQAWEEAIASTIIHYINEVLQDMSLLDSESYDFAAHAKHWSELKGFALSLQFNPHSPLSDSQFQSLHALLQDAPILSHHTPEEIMAYQESLREARTLLGDTYGFASSNLGDEQGIGGW